MSTNADSTENNLVLGLEQKFQQLLLQRKSYESTVKTSEDNLNNCLKRNILLEHELKTERLKKSMMKIKLDTLILTLDKFNNRNNDSSSGSDVNVLTNDSEYLSNKIFSVQRQNIRLKQELAKSNSKVSQAMKNQYKYSEKIVKMNLMFNSLKEEVINLEKQSHILIQILRISKTLTRKILNAFEYYKNLKTLQFGHIQHLMKDVAIINSKMHSLVNQNEKNQMVKPEEKNALAINQTHIEICNNLVEILQAENDTLHKDILHILNTPTNVPVNKSICKNSEINIDNDVNKSMDIE